ncbi:MAG: hypothetical protein CM1200mP41_30490 [Gammaproteobacteria bacterium]|nr:MAG: hypothetical protein CM1200mP41_30490 [Gammaproteobacteria bacterium]
MTGYVHKPYPPIYTELARLAGYSSAMVVRGIEGGVIPSLNQASKCFSYQDGMPDEEMRLDPKTAGVISVTRTVPWPVDKERLESHVDSSITVWDKGSVRWAERWVRLGRGFCTVHRYVCCIWGGFLIWATARVCATRALDSGESLARFQRATQQ